MTRHFRARFDGKVLVPEEPVDLPVGRSLGMSVEETPAPSDHTALAKLADWVESLPPVGDDDLPTDLAAQHDHYLYGHPKRP